MEQHVKTGLDITALLVTAATLVKLLPYLAAAASLVWSLIRIYETRTVQGWISKARKRGVDKKTS